jgi:hypothetical protein
MTNPYDLLIDSYLDNNIGLDAGFLSTALSSGLQQNILQLQKDDMMHAAGIGNDTVKDAAQKMREIKFTGWTKATTMFLNRNFCSR